MDSHPLTDKQRRFVSEYAVDQNATQAAIRAGYSAKTAGNAGSFALKNKHVRHHIEARAAQIAEKTAMTAGEVLRRLTLMASFELPEVMEDIVDAATGLPNGKKRLKPMANWSEAARVSVFGVKLDKDGNVVEIKCADKHQATVDLGRSHGLFKDVLETSSEGERQLGERLRQSEADLEAELNGKSTRLKLVSG